MPNQQQSSERVNRGDGEWLMDSPPGAQTRLGDREYLYFAGAGYLGLQGHPAVIEALRAAATRYGVHSATSRALFGDCEPVREVECRAARLLGAEEAIYLVSGYAGAFAIAAMLASQVGLVLIDEAAHDCLRESAACFTSAAQPPLVFRHRDADHVRELLATHARFGRRALLLTDGVFAVSGRLAPLADYLQALDRYEGSLLLVDDAHGLATLGEHGRGSLELAGIPAAAINRSLDEPADGSCDELGDELGDELHEALRDELHDGLRGGSCGESGEGRLARPLTGAVASSTRVFHSTSLSKAIGGHGGLVAGSRGFVDRIRRASGWYRAASAPPAPIAAATAKALEIVDREPALRARLAENIATLRAGLREIGAPVSDDPTPVIGLELDSAQRMLAVRNRLLAQGIAIAYARDYTGAGPAGLLRIAVFATHSSETIGRLIAALEKVIRQGGP